MLSTSIKWWLGIPRRPPPPYRSKLITLYIKLHQTSDIFTITGVSVSCKGKKYLEAPLGTDAFVHSLSTNKSPPGKKNLKYCLNLQSPNPMLLMLPLHMHGFTSKWTYLTRVVPNISDFFCTITSHNILTLCYRSKFTQ